MLRCCVGTALTGVGGEQLGEISSSSDAKSSSRRMEPSPKWWSATPLALATGAVVTSQITFILTAYCHAFFTGALAPHRFHVSAVLDDDDRSVLCAFVGVISLFLLVILESLRALPLPRTRACLALTTGIGIVLNCTVRESHHINAHRCTAVLAFGAAVALVCVVSWVARDTRSRQGAIALSVLVVITGSAQFLNVVAQIYLGRNEMILPSWVLGCLELGLILGFALCIWACANAGANRNGLGHELLAVRFPPTVKTLKA